jgi:XTP/dITP diphosphohydrolase
MKKIIYYITGNKSKFEEAQLILNNLGVTLTKKDLILTELQSTDQECVVLDKAKQAFKKLKKPLVVDDTGIFFEQYNGFPGVYTKPLFNTIGIKGIQKLLDGVNRKAYFRTLVCYKDEKITKVFSGVWKGKITKNISKSYNPDWQYNSIFIPQGFKKPLSEISMEQRIKNSHRSKALLNLLGYLKNIGGESG